mgnify:CR=1 FL=1
MVKLSLIMITLVSLMSGADAGALPAGCDLHKSNLHPIVKGASLTIPRTRVSAVNISADNQTAIIFGHTILVCYGSGKDLSRHQTTCGFWQQIPSNTYLTIGPGTYALEYGDSGRDKTYLNATRRVTSEMKSFFVFCQQQWKYLDGTLGRAESVSVTREVLELSLRDHNNNSPDHVAIGSLNIPSPKPVPVNTDDVDIPYLPDSDWSI